MRVFLTPFHQEFMNGLTIAENHDGRWAKLQAVDGTVYLGPSGKSVAQETSAANGLHRGNLVAMGKNVLLK